MTSKRKKLLIRVGATILGAAGGFLFYLKVGCTTGACPLTSEPFFPTLWGGLFGWFLFGPGERKPDKKETTKNESLGI
jgi:hypothetical protein